MQDYEKLIKETREEARRTGRRIKKVISKDDFCKQFPKAAADPRMALTPKEFLLDMTPMTAMTVQELRELCIAKGDHPLAVQKAISVAGLADHQVVNILTQDLNTLKEDSPTGILKAPSSPSSEDTPLLEETTTPDDSQSGDSQDDA